MQASVVVLPDPVGPVTRKMPRGRRQICSAISWQPDLLEGHDLVGNLSKHEAGGPLLLEDRDAKTGLLAVGKAEVAGARFFEFLLNAIGRDGLHQRHRVFGIKHLGLQLAQCPCMRSTGGRPTAR